MVFRTDIFPKIVVGCPCLRSVTNFRFNLSISQITKWIEKIFVTNEPINTNLFIIGKLKWTTDDNLHVRETELDYLHLPVNTVLHHSLNDCDNFMNSHADSVTFRFKNLICTIFPWKPELIIHSRYFYIMCLLNFRKCYPISVLNIQSFQF